MITARNELRSAEGSVFGAVSLFLFVYEISLEPPNGFAPDSHGRRVWSPRSDEFDGQGQRSRSPGSTTAFSAPSAACMRFMFAKTSFASSLFFSH